MKSRNKILDYLKIFAVFFAAYNVMSFCIPGLRIKLDAEPLEYFLKSMSHMALFKIIVSAVAAYILPVIIKLILILASSSNPQYKLSLKNVSKAFKYQLPPYRSLANFLNNFFVTHNGLGMFSINSHVNKRNGKEKVPYSSFESAKKAADKMGQKHNTHFSVYKCAYCDGFHIGRNRDNK